MSGVTGMTDQVLARVKCWSVEAIAGNEEVTDAVVADLMCRMDEIDITLC